MPKYFILGLGLVGDAFLRLCMRNGEFEPASFYCIDKNPEAIKRFITSGGKKENATEIKITKENYAEAFSILSSGDYLLDFSIDIKNLDLLKFCLERRIHYLSTADSSWNPDPSWRSAHQHFLEYKKIKATHSLALPTCIIEFGMNPGLVSVFLKKAIKEIINTGKGFYFLFNRKKLLKYAESNKYALIAKKLGITAVEISDFDDQNIKAGIEENTLYSTWNPHSFFYEIVSSPEIFFGTEKELLAYRDKIIEYDLKDLYVSLRHTAVDNKHKSYSLCGAFYGHLTTHEEIYSIGDYLSLYKNGKLIYKPTTRFIYLPSVPARTSLKYIKENNFQKPQNIKVLDKKDISEGGETVGVVIYGKRFKTRFFGNRLTIADTEQSPTILQVGASAFAAFKYMKNHPNQGFLFPEELDDKEILNEVTKYIGALSTITYD